jgi:hypothetical protein
LVNTRSIQGTPSASPSASSWSAGMGAAASTS